jgi:hypothetical protein
MQMVRQSGVAVAGGVDSVVPPHDGQGLPDVRAGCPGALQRDAELWCVEDGYVPYAVEEEGILNDTSVPVQTCEQRILEIRLVQVRHMVAILTAAAMPVSREWGQQYLLGCGLDAE